VKPRGAARYEELLHEVLIYNSADLEAMWAVFVWLARSFGHEPAPM